MKYNYRSNIKLVNQLLTVVTISENMYYIIYCTICIETNFEAVSTKYCYNNTG
jgi:hypothetical protein